MRICARKYAAHLTTCILPFSFFAFILRKISRVFPLENTRDPYKSLKTVPSCVDYNVSDVIFGDVMIFD